MALLGSDRVFENEGSSTEANTSSLLTADAPEELTALEKQIVDKANEILPAPARTRWGRFQRQMPESKVTIEYIAENQPENTISTKATLHRDSAGVIKLSAAEWTQDRYGDYEFLGRTHASISGAEVTYVPAPDLSPQAMLVAYTDIYQTLERFQPAQTPPATPVE